MEMKSCARFFVCWLLHFVSSSQATRADAVIVAQCGHDISLSWKVPDSLKNALLVVSLNSAENVVFFVATAPGAPEAVVTSGYGGRVKVKHDAARSQVEFTLRNVSQRDAGRYLCSKGLREADVVEDCGKTLVVVDTPADASIISADAPPLIGSDVTLKCTARSSTSPRDHEQPMTFQWFEARNDQDQNGTLVWSPFHSGTEENSQDVDYFDNHDDDENGDPGSGEGGVEVVMGSFGRLSNVLEIDSIAHSDDGRIFACSASEGFDLWSGKSQPYFLRPEWKPEPSDVTFTNVGNYVTEGESTRVMCSAKCRPDCSVKWQKVKSDDQAATVTTSSTLSVTRARRQQQGLYRCVVSNRHGQAFRTVTINVLDRPVPWYSQPSHVIAVVAGVTLLLILCMSGVAFAVVKCRQRPSPIMWPGKKKPSDAVPLSSAVERPSMVSYL